MATENRILDGSWQVLATGPSTVSFEPQEQGAEWALDTDQLEEGHTARAGRTQNAVLSDGETIYIKGSGRLTVTVT